jgi:hypothetical protein
VGLFFLLGVFRGAQKSLYFLIVNIITTILVIFLISQISIYLLFNFIDQQSFFDMINGYAGGALDDYMSYLNDPTISNTIFIFVDLVLRIVGFFVLYPILKRILTFLIFRPIWSFGIKKAIIRKQNNDLEDKSQEQNKNFKKRKRIKKGPVNRLVGGLFGGVHGFIIVFMILIPVTVTASYVSDVDTTALASIGSDSDQLATGVGGFQIPDEILQYLEEVQEMNELGFASITRQIIINESPIDQYIFDEIFTVQTEIDDEVVDVNFISELENIMGIATILINGGYLDEDFDYTQISTDNLEDVEAIFDYIGSSDVLSYMVPVAAKYGIENILADQIGMNLYDRDASQAAIDMFLNIDWNNEFDRLYALVESVLEFGSVEEIMAFADDPTTLTDITPEQGVALANILRSVGDLEVLSLINVGIDYLTTLEEVQTNISWIDNASEKEDYLQEKLAFILDDPDFFVGENGEITEIANLIELIFSDTYGDTNLDVIVDANGDPGVILEQSNAAWVSALISQLTELELLMNALPIGVDFALYEIGGDTIDQTLADDFETVMADVDWTDEFDNFDNIYQSIVKLGLEEILSDNPDYYAYIDDIVTNNMDDVRDIIAYIFEDSQIVGSALDILAPTLIENYLTDEDIKEIVQDIVLDDEDAFDFNVGQEIISILDIAELTYGFADIQSLQGFTTMTQEEQLTLLADFGDMDDEDYTAFLAAFDNLQILNRIDETVAQNIVDKYDLADTVYIPTSFALNDDITAILDMVHDIGVYLNDNDIAGVDYKDLDLTNLLSVLSDDLLDETQRSDLLFYNIAFYAKKYADDPSLSNYLAIPDSLLNAGIESQAWDDEISALFGSVFDIAEVIGQTDGITLSVNDILLYANEAYRLPIEVITQFSDLTVAQDAFSSLDSSLILRTSISNLIDNQGESLSGSLYGHVITTPAHLQTDGVLDSGIFVDLIHGFGSFTKGMNDTLAYETIGQFTFDDLTPLFNAFNQMDEADIEALVETDLLHGVISELLLDTDFQSEIVTVLNNAQDLFDFPSDLLEVDDELVDDGVLVNGEITSLFIMVQSLQVTSVDELTGVGLETFTNLVVADPLTGEDSFDEFFGSNYIYTLLDKVLQMESLHEYVGTMLGDALGADFATLDLTIPDEMLGQPAQVTSGDIEPIEEDRIPREEFRRMLVSLGQLGDLGDLGINTFTDMIDPADVNDNFSVFIESDFIYLVLSRLIGNTGFSTYAEDALSGAFGDDPVDLDMAVPTDALGSTGIEIGYISRVEVRNLMVSFKMLGFDGTSELDVSTIINMPSTDTYPTTGQDDLDIFLNSIYLRDKMSQMLLSETIIDLIGAGQFTYADFDLPVNAYDSESRLSQDQIHAVFDSLILLGIADFDNLDIGISSVTDLTPTEQSQLLDSIYLYEVIDLMIKAQEGDLTIPFDAYVSGGFYDQMISEDEILAVLSVFDIPEIGSDPTAIDTNAITVTVLEDVLDKGSLIINQMISDQIESALTIDNLSVPEAYEAIVGVDRILLDEMKALVAAMEEMGLTDLSAAISVDSVGLTELQNIHYLGLGTDPVLDNYDSYIIHNLLSEQIESTLSVSFATLPEAYFTTASNIDRLSADEIQALIEAMTEMGITDLSISFDANNVNTTQLQNLHYLGLGTDPVSDDYDSYIVHRMLSDGIKDVLTDRPSTIYMTNGDITADEIQGVIEAIGILNNNPNASLAAMSFANSGLTPAKIESLLDIGSLLVDRQISAGIISAGLAVDEAYAEVGDFNYDSLAINEDLKEDEMYALVAAMTEMGITDLSGTFSASNITVSELQNVHYLGLGTDPVTDDYDSYIIHHMLSDGIKDALTDRPSTIYMANDDITADEIQDVIEAIGILNNDPNASLASMSFANGGLTPTKIESLLDLDSLLIDRQISAGIISAGLAVNEAYAEVGDFNYDSLAVNEDLKEDEMYALVEAMNIMGLTDLDAAFAPDSITINNLQSLHYVGLGDDGGANPYDSYIVHNMISDSVESSLDVPTDGYMVSGYMLEAEVQGVIDALYAISGDPATDTLLDIMPVATSTFSPSLIDELLDIGALTIYRLVADGIISSGISTLESEAELGDANYDSNAIGDDLKLTEMYGLAEAMEILGVTDVTQVANINAATILGLTDTEVDTVLDNSNTITYFIIDDAIDPDDLFFPGDYVLDEAGNQRIIRSVLITYIKDNN